MNQPSPSPSPKHPRWVKTTHGLVTLSFLLLAFTGFVILMSHPRLYWGDAGNDLTPALFEIPISRNYHHGGWEKPMPFFTGKASPVSAARTYDIFNQNGWGRSLHFLSAWVLVITGMIYLLVGLFSGYFRRTILPGKQEWSWKTLAADFSAHLQAPFRANSLGKSYGPLQKLTYALVIFWLCPTVFLTGMAMSPAVAAAFPMLLNMFFGAQSARTIHFFTASALELFLAVHLLMVIRTGFRQQVRSMTWG